MVLTPEIRQRFSALHDVLDPLQEALVVADCDGQVVFANPAAELSLGLASLKKQTPDSGSFPALVTRILRGEVADGEDVFAAATNSQDSRWLSVRVWPLREDTGLPGRAIWVRDTTTAKQAAEVHAREKEEAEGANRAKSEFLRRSSQELRSHLNSILGFAQMLAVHQLTLQQRENVQRILTGGYHLLELIGELVDLTHIETGQIGNVPPEPIRIREALRNALQAMQPLAAERNLTVRLDIEACYDSHVRADRRRLTQAFVSLLASVFRSSSSGGVVSLACRETPGNRLRIDICYDATNGGDGSRRLFTPAELLSIDLANLGDSDLGLALTQRLVKAMSGNIGFEQTTGAGTRLFIEFFLLDDPLERLEGDSAAMLALAQGVPQAQKGTVLYVEDNPTNLRLIEDILSYRPGIKLLKALDAKTGLHLAEVHTPDWILLDLNLPDMSGETVVRRLRANQRTFRIPITVLSGDTDPQRIRQMVAAGARDYLTKPLHIQKLLDLLDHTLRIQS